MTTTTQRTYIAELIEQACKSGACMHQACRQIGLTCRTLQRWVRPSAQAPSSALVPQAAQRQQESQASVQAAPPVARASELAVVVSTEVTPATPVTPACIALACIAPAQAAQEATAQPIAQATQTALQDHRPVRQDHRQAHLRQAPTPHNKLTPQEREALLGAANSEEFKDLPASQIVPRLADLGIYLGSESSLQRLLRSKHQNTHRRSTRAARQHSKPLALKASAVNQVYTWDITYLPTTIKGQYFYLYVFVDIFSRCIVGAQVFGSESAELAAALLKDICQRHGIDKDQLHLHSDNGSPMKGSTMLAMMQQLGVIASRSRPSLSNDNPYSESLFATLKYRPLMPLKAFESIEQARHWSIGLIDWYNQQHRHSAIKFVTPEQRHLGQDAELLQKRNQLYAQARAQNPQRCSGNTRNWSRISEVHLNPDKPVFKESKHPENKP